MNNVNLAIANWRENDRNLYTLSFENFQGKNNPWNNFFSLNTMSVLDIPQDRKRNNLNNTNTLKCYFSDEPARGF